MLSNVEQDIFYNPVLYVCEKLILIFTVSKKQQTTREQSATFFFNVLQFIFKTLYFQQSTQNDPFKISFISNLHFALLSQSLLSHMSISR